MLCPKCSTTITTDLKFCPSCGVALPQQIPDKAPTVSLGIKEGVTYLTPTHHYETPPLKKLSEIFQAILDGEEQFEELEDQLQVMAGNFADFEDLYAAEMQALLVQESNRFPQDDYNIQMSYLLRRGLQIFEEGCQAFDQFFDNESDDADELEAAYTKVRDGHDFLCFAMELARERLVALQEVVTDLEDLDDDEEYVFIDVPAEDP